MTGQGELHGWVAVVTGASGGIGRATARQLAERGATVLVHGFRQGERLEATKAELAGPDRGHHAVQADLSSRDEIEQLLRLAWDWQPRIDIWVNFAGADVLTGEARDWDFERKFERLWQVDVLGTMRVCRGVGSRMQAQASGPGRPVILNVGWDQALPGMGHEAGEMFGPIKSAVTSFSLSLARRLAPQVRVNVIAPGWIQTAWGAEQASPYWDERARSESLSHRWGQPEDVAHAAAYLAGPQADFVTGHVLPVNGGFRHEFDPPPEPRQNS